MLTVSLNDCLHDFISAKCVKSKNQKDYIWFSPKACGLDENQLEIKCKVLENSVAT